MQSRVTRSTAPWLARSVSGFFLLYSRHRVLTSLHSGLLHLTSPPSGGGMTRANSHAAIAWRIGFSVTQLLLRTKFVHASRPTTVCALFLFCAFVFLCAHQFFIGCARKQTRELKNEYERTKTPAASSGYKSTCTRLVKLIFFVCVLLLIDDCFSEPWLEVDRNSARESR